MTFNKIPEAELEIMKIIWRNEGPTSSKDIVSAMEENKGWKNTTTLTLLSRLTEKQIITAKKEKKITYYTANITEQSYLSLETRSFFKRLHGNSLKSFITTLHQNNDITDEDLDELEKWIKDR